jgi:hypothetical protein
VASSRLSSAQCSHSAASFQQSCITPASDTPLEAMRRAWFCGPPAWQWQSGPNRTRRRGLHGRLPHSIADFGAAAAELFCVRWRSLCISCWLLGRRPRHKSTRPRRHSPRPFCSETATWLQVLC